MWQEDGIQVSPEPTIMFGGMDETVMIGDNAGGAVFAWLNNQVDPEVDPVMLTLQHINANGQLLWGSPGTVVGIPSHGNFHKMISDEAGGVIVVYTVIEGVPGSPATDIRAQRVLMNGSTAWQEGGVWVTKAPRSQINPHIVGDSEGGAIITWQHEPDEDNAGCYSVFEDCDIYAQRLNRDGESLWQENGISISSAENSQHSPIIVSDSDGGAVIAWQDCRLYPDRDECIFNMDIYVQRVTKLGNVLWTIDGIPLTEESGNQGIAPGTPLSSIIAGVKHTCGGATFVWPDGRETFCFPSYYDSNCDVFAQQLLFSNGTPACSEDIDGDGFTNTEEIKCGSDPADSSSICFRGLPWLMLLLD
jgi:hypothetical protein